MLPLGFVPFSNTLPALARIFFGWKGVAGQLFILLGHLADVFSVVYFAALIGVSGWSIIKLLRRMN